MTLCMGHNIRTYVQGIIIACISFSVELQMEHAA